MYASLRSVSDEYSSLSSNRLLNWSFFALSSSKIFRRLFRLEISDVGVGVAGVAGGAGVAGVVRGRKGLEIGELISEPRAFVPFGKFNGFGERGLRRISSITL